ncbi:MAG: hypothetical protein OXB88_01895, partial [Bacteriovoracales bacterium]|nr:hypothetical protein [Bacteriovoracales bacterium]
MSGISSHTILQKGLHCIDEGEVQSRKKMGGQGALRAYPKTTFVMKASEIVPGKDESKKCLKACLWHVEGIFCLKTKPGTIAA